MTAPVDPFRRIIGNNPQVDVGEYRRKIDAELQALQTMLLAEKDRMGDPLTDEIVLWYDRFTQDRSRLRQHFIDGRRGPDRAQFTDEALKREERFLYVRAMYFLNKLLKEPTGIPLDEEAFLGSDKEVYNSITLPLYLMLPLQGRSPLHQDDPRPFTVRPHTVVREMAKWLKPYVEATPHHREYELMKERYEELKAQKMLPPLPLEGNARFRNIFAAHQAARQATLNRVQAQVAQQAAEMAQEEEAFTEETNVRFEQADGRRDEAHARDQQAADDFAQQDLHDFETFERTCDDAEARLNDVKEKLPKLHDEVELFA